MLPIMTNKLQKQPKSGHSERGMARSHPPQAVGTLVQAWGAASQRRPVGEGMDVGAVQEFGRAEQAVG